MHFVGLVGLLCELPFGWLTFEWSRRFCSVLVLVFWMMSNDISSWADLMTGWWFAVDFRGFQLPQLSDWLTGWGDCFRWKQWAVQYLVVDIGIVHRFLGLSPGSLSANVAAIAMLQCCRVAVLQYCSSLYLGLVLPSCYLCNLSWLPLLCAGVCYCNTIIDCCFPVTFYFLLFTSPLFRCSGKTCIFLALLPDS